MKFSFRKAFFPTPEEIAVYKETARKAHEDAVEKKHCIACVFYDYDARVPGMVGYQGDCEKSHVPFLGDNPYGICKDWKLDEEVDAYYRREG